MSNFKGHVIGSIATGAIGTFVIANYFVMPFNPLIFIGCSFIGGIFPDSDIASKSRKVIYTMFLCIILYAIYISNFLLASLVGLFAVLPAISKHRGWTHSFFAMIFVPCIFIFPLIYIGFLSQTVGIIYYIGMVLGYLSHLILDKI